MGFPASSSTSGITAKKVANLELWLLRLAGSCLLIVAVTGLLPGYGAETDWPRFLNNGFDGAASTTPTIDWTQPPELVWSRTVGPGYAIGSVVDGRYYSFDAASVASARALVERLTAIDIVTGATIWSVDRPLNYRDLYGYEEGPRSSPTIRDDKILTLGVAGDLCCRAVKTGNLLWSVDTSEKYTVVQNFFGVGASPLVIDDVVIVMVGGSPQADAALPPGRVDRASPNGCALVAFDLNSGEERWRGGDDLASYSSPRTIELAGQTYLLVFARERLWLIDPRDGTAGWSFSHRADLIESVNAMMPVVSGDQVLISECYQLGSALLKVTPRDYEVVWKDPLGARRQSLRAHWATPILIDGYLYGCSGRNAPDSDFRCLKFETGEVQWVDSRRIRSSVCRVGDVLVLLEEHGKLQVINPTPEKLQVLATWDLGQPEGARPALRPPCWAAPVVVGDRLLVRGDRHVLCLRLARVESR